MSWIQAPSWVKNKLTKGVLFLTRVSPLLGFTARLPGSHVGVLAWRRERRQERAAGGTEGCATPESSFSSGYSSSELGYGFPFC